MYPRNIPATTTPDHSDSRIRRAVWTQSSNTTKSLQRQVTRPSGWIPSSKTTPVQQRHVIRPSAWTPISTTTQTVEESTTRLSYQTFSPDNHSTRQEFNTLNLSCPSYNVNTTPVTERKVVHSTIPSPSAHSTPVTERRVVNSTIPLPSAHSTPVTERKVVHSTFLSTSLNSTPVTDSRVLQSTITSPSSNSTPVTDRRVFQSTIPSPSENTTPLLICSQIHQKTPPVHERYPFHASIVTSNTNVTHTMMQQPTNALFRSLSTDSTISSTNQTSSTTATPISNQQPPHTTNLSARLTPVPNQHTTCSQSASIRSPQSRPTFNIKLERSFTPRPFTELKDGKQITVDLVKGSSGFGFTLLDTNDGQMIKSISDPTRCKQLAGGDILLQINGFWVKDMPHQEVVNILKRCPRGTVTTVKCIRTGQYAPSICQFTLYSTQHA